jgi:dolichol kinase
MNTDLLHTALLAGAFLLLFATAEVLYHWLHVKVELTRKFVHVGTGMLTLLFPVLLNNHWLVLFLCASFAMILIVSLRFRLLPSINAIERFSVGSLAYPVSVYGCYLVFDHFHYNYVYFYAPILILAICDPVAALMGKRWPKGKYAIGKETKTLMGSGMFLFSALIVYGTLMLCLFPGTPLVLLIAKGLVVATISCVAEALSGKGTDNLTIPVAVLLGLFITQLI